MTRYHDEKWREILDPLFFWLQPSKCPHQPLSNVIVVLVNLDFSSFIILTQRIFFSSMKKFHSRHMFASNVYGFNE